uniref:UBC core domain-containing protein n=1 Tax=Arcella intermedia TaxID=1963864 RepID=A0A6B2L378_9EUKA
MVKVKWCNDNNSTEEEVSCYDLIEHEEYKFRLGSVVLSLSKYDVGEVVELCGDKIKVTWSDHTTSEEKYDTLNVFDSEDEEEEEVDYNYEDEENYEDGDEEYDINDEDIDQFSAGFLDHFIPRAMDLLGSFWNSTSNETQDPVTHVQEENNVQEEEKQEDNPPHQEDTTSSHTELEQSFTEESSFVVLDEIHDHHFIGFQDPPPKIGRVAMKEWKSLQTKLPNIYITSYTSRMDLMKVLIIGSQNTIFNNSYFVFHICLPPEYPNVPPKVFYQSGGYKLHPNLYDDGNVCLSLLGTWVGDSVESWTPGKSNILQVVLSLQGLILGVKEPYYLEAGYDKQKGTKQGAASSAIYNEKSLILSLKRMLQLYQHPPPEFRLIIKKHFQEHYEDPLNLFSLCEKLLETPDHQAQAIIKQKYKDIVTKYFLMEAPSRGFLIPMVKDLKEKFEEEINKSKMNPPK